MSEHGHPLGTVQELEEDLDDLESSLRGDLVLPDHESYERARNVWNGLINKYPAVTVQARGSGDVGLAVDFARRNDLDLSIRGGSHNQTGAAVAENGLVIDMKEIDHIIIEPEKNVARIGPGNSVEDVLAETQEYGLAPPTGSASGVGISGPTLGGGIGWFRRKYGLAIDALRSVEIVTADGELRRASSDSNSDLFWAVRGGGGNFGIVVDFEFDLFDVGPMVAGLGVFYPAESSDSVLEVHRNFMHEAPEELTTILLYGHVPPLPSIPDDVSGEEAIAILGCYAGNPEEGMQITDTLRNIDNPIIDMSGPMPYESLHDLGSQMYPWGRNYVHRSVFVDELSDDVHDIIQNRLEAAPSPMDVIAIWALGGNIGHGSPSAFPWVDKQFMITIEANWEHFDNDEEFQWAHQTERELRNAGGEGAYGGFTGVEEQPWEDWSEQVYADNYNQLLEAKRAYDPDNVFKHNVNIEPAP